MKRSSRLRSGGLSKACRSIQEHGWYRLVGSRRLMRYGGPAGAQVFLDVLVFNFFVQLVGRLGEAALGATTLTVRLNMVAFLPMMGLGQAVSILVGQRLGADRPDLAERSAYTGLRWVFGYMSVVASAYLLIPHDAVNEAKTIQGLAAAFARKSLIQAVVTQEP